MYLQNVFTKSNYMLFVLPRSFYLMRQSKDFGNNSFLEEE